LIPEQDAPGLLLVLFNFDFPGPVFLLVNRERPGAPLLSPIPPGWAPRYFRYYYFITNLIATITTTNLTFQHNQEAFAGFHYFGLLGYSLSRDDFI